MTSKVKVTVDEITIIAPAKSIKINGSNPKPRRCIVRKYDNRVSWRTVENVKYHWQAGILAKNGDWFPLRTKTGRARKFRSEKTAMKAAEWFNKENLERYQATSFREDSLDDGSIPPSTIKLAS